MARPSGIPLGDETRTAGSKTATEDGDVTASRMVNMAIGLELDWKDTKTVTHAFATMPDSEHSLNQSLAYIRDTPLFLDLELKRTMSNRDPHVQLAIWQAALHSKRLHHHWDTSMPMPGIIVNGHDWLFYLTFEKEGDLVGPPS